MPDKQPTKYLPYDGDLRRDLLDTAVAMVAQGDPAHFSLRAVARAVGVSHAAPKNHFADKRALLTAIAIEGFHQLNEHVEQIPLTQNPVDALEQLAVTYVRFSRDNPGYFRVMWRADLIDRTDPEIAAAGTSLYTRVSQLISESSADSWWRGADAEQLATAYWSMVHGLAQLNMDGAIPAIVEKDAVQVMQSASSAIRTLIALDATA